MSPEDEAVQWVDDVSPAAWIGPRLHPSGHDVGAVIPEGFEAYGRLFHPVEPRDGSAARQRWSDLARRNGRIVHPEMQFHWVSRPRGQRPPEGYERGSGPSWGSLPLEERRVLVELLTPGTGTPDACWFCIWDGYSPLYDLGDVRWFELGGSPALGRRPPRRESRRRELASAPGVELPHRSYFLYRGPVVTALAPVAGDQSPNLWWPEDRAWLVATEVDFAWTYVGGSRTLVDTVMADDRLEVLPAHLTDQPFYDADALNAALDAE